MYAIQTLALPPMQSAAGTVRLPGSKSISNRVLLLAALCAGRTAVHDLLDSDDTQVMLTALRQLGCGIEQDANTSVLYVQGLGTQGLGTPSGAQVPHKNLDFFLGNAGTAMRPLTAALALLASRHAGCNFTLRGVPRMHERPIGDLVDALQQLGCAVRYTGQAGYPPLAIQSCGPLNLDAPIAVRGDVSSQFLTALLMALPLVAEKDVHIDVVGELISKPYIEITLGLMARFGVHVKREGWQRFTVPAGSAYQSPSAVYVEGDASAASYFVALGAVAATQARPLRIEGVGSASIQGDIRFVEAAQQMGACVALEPNALTVWRENAAQPLTAIDLDCNHIPDAAMTLAVMALYAEGTTTLRNIASWRVKETDRIAAMATELRKLGAAVVETPDSIAITPPEISPETPSITSPITPSAAYGWRSAAIHTYDDHRMAMCFSLAAFNGLVSRPAVAVHIEDPACVAKTYPDYFEEFFRLCAPAPGGVPVVCIDGPSASGKGTLASRVAAQLGYHYLDSGALYRAVAVAAQQAGVDLGDEAAVARVAQGLDLRFGGSQDGQANPSAIYLNGVECSTAIRSEAGGMAASRISAHPAVRHALVDLQRGFRRAPGLVADGRDMGTVIFADARYKFFLTASAAVRAQRRYAQIVNAGGAADLGRLQRDLEQRDAQDANRTSAPLKPAGDAVLLDNSALNIDETVKQVLAKLSV